MGSFVRRVRSWRRLALLASLMLGVVIVPEAVAGASTHRTRLLNLDGGQFQVRPATVNVAGDGTHLFGGLRRPGHRFGHIDWRSWGLADAYGRAIYWVDTCNPDCAQGTYYNWGAVKLHAWRTVNHRFTRLTANGKRIHQTFHLTFDGTTWYWR